MEIQTDIFVPYGIAQKLKGIGFDEPCMVGYSQNENKFYIDFEKMINSKCIEFKDIDLSDFNNWDYMLSIPTYEQVFKWFREKGYHIIIDKVSDRYGCFIRQEKRIDGEIKTDIYEQAREQAILKTIEIYKTQ